MNPIVEGLAVNSISALAHGVLSRINEKYALPYRMRQALKGEALREKNSSILDALERAIGNSSGLTRPINQSLQDISSSGLLDHLLLIFGSDSPDIDARKLIEYIHTSRGSNSREDSIAFSNNLADCLKVAQNDYIQRILSHNPPDRIKHLERRLADNARRSAAIVSSLVSNLIDKNGNWIEGQDSNPETLARYISCSHDPLYNYAKAMARTLNVADIHGASGDVVKIDLDQIYVDVPVTMIPRDRNFIPYQDLRRHLPRRLVANNWSDTLDQVSKTVLLGDPGGGKSTLSKKMCLEIAKQFMEGRTILPVFVQLRTYIALAADDDRLSLTRYIIDSFNSTVLDPDDQPLDATVIYHLKIGAVFIVADGLDEVLTATNRSRVVSELQRIAKEFPLASILVTSRYVGYEAQPLSGFNHLGVDHLDESSIKEIYRNVSQAVLKKSPADTEKDLPTFLTDAHKKAAELIRSPLLLTLIVIIYSKKSEIPDNRASLYGFCADLLFDRWDGYRDIIPDLPERYRLFDLFKHLSALLYEKEEYGGRINKADLLEEARDFFRKDYIDNKEGRSAKAAKHMVDHLTGRAWILHEVGEDVFEFTHRTFMEFFYARHVETVYESTEGLISECMQHVSVGSRSVPSHLALQIRTKDKRGASTTACNALGESISRDPYNGDLIDFSLDALGYLLPDAASMSQFVGKLAPTTLALGHPKRPIKLLCNDSPMRSTILASSISTLEGVKKVDDIRVLAPALYNMFRSGRDSLQLEGRKTLNICQMVINQNYSKQASSPFLWKLAFDMDAKVNWRALQAFGNRIWLSETSMGMENLITDSKQMLASSGRRLIDPNSADDKYLRLASTLCKSQQSFSGKNCRENFYISSQISIEGNQQSIDLPLDPATWHDDIDSLERFAFCMVVFLEVCIDSISRSDLEIIKTTFSTLLEALRDAKSEKAEWYSKWATGETAPILIRRYRERGQRHFLEM